MKKKGIIWDLDHTLVDTEYAHVMANEKSSYNTSQLSKMMRVLASSPFPSDPNTGIHTWRNLLWGKITDEQDSYTDWHNKRLTYFKLDNKITDLLIASSHLPSCVVTNGDSSTQWDKIQACNIREFINNVVVCGDRGIQKPNPAPLLEAASLMGALPEDCLVIGDSYSDINGARNAGMSSILAEWYIARDIDGIDFTRMNQIEKLKQYIQRAL